MILCVAFALLALLLFLLLALLALLRFHVATLLVQIVLLFLQTLAVFLGALLAQLLSFSVGNPLLFAQFVEFFLLGQQLSGSFFTFDSRLVQRFQLFNSVVSGDGAFSFKLGIFFRQNHRLLDALQDVRDIGSATACICSSDRAETGDFCPDGFHTLSLDTLALGFRISDALFFGLDCFINGRFDCQHSILQRLAEFLHLVDASLGVLDLLLVRNQRRLGGVGQGIAHISYIDPNFLRIRQTFAGRAINNQLCVSGFQTNDLFFVRPVFGDVGDGNRRDNRVLCVFSFAHFERVLRECLFICGHDYSLPRGAQRLKV